MKVPNLLTLLRIFFVPLLVAALLGPEYGPGWPVYIPVSRERFALAPRHQTLVDTLQLFVTSILRGTFPAFPEEKDYNACKYCPVHDSCRTRHDPADKYAVIAAKDPQTLLRGLL